MRLSPYNPLIPLTLFPPLFMPLSAFQIPTPDLPRRARRSQNIVQVFAVDKNMGN